MNRIENLSVVELRLLRCQVRYLLGRRKTAPQLQHFTGISPERGRAILGLAREMVR